MDTEKIVKHCKSGDQIAQGILFNTHYKPMYNLSMRMLTNHQDVEDVLIISFTKVFSNIKKFEFRGDNSLTKWIKTIVINETIRFINSRNRINFEVELTENDIDSTYHTDLTDIDIEQIYSIIETMPDGYRMVFNLFAIEGYSHKEISEMLNISENTSKSQLRKARINIIEKINKIKKYENS